MKILVTISVFGLFLTNGLFQKKEYLLTKGYVASGYDVVSYFQKEPKIGNEAFSTEYDKAKFKFATLQNLNTFKANPEKYIPKYGGWCAYAIGLNGQKVSVDPKNYRIFNNELFLFYKTKRNNTLDDWLKNEKELYKKAEINWKKSKDDN